MYQIEEKSDRDKYILLIPAMLDAHFPLLKYAFYSPDYHPVVLENEENITETGLKFVNHDMCYPSVLITGQMIEAIRKLNVDQARIRLLMPAAGDACCFFQIHIYTGIWQCIFTDIIHEIIHNSP